MNSLHGRCIALSISDPPDRGKLGFPRREIDRMLFSTCTTLIREGARVLYGGNLDPAGYTFKIFRHLAGQYAPAGTTPFVHVIAEPVLRAVPYDYLVAALKEHRGTCETFACIGSTLFPLRQTVKGVLVGTKNERTELTTETHFRNWLSSTPALADTLGYTAARKALCRMSDGRISIGGKMGIVDVPEDHYQGTLPGTVEEAIITLQSGKPLIPLGAFGGATRDMAIALGLLPSDTASPRGPHLASYKQAIKQVALYKSNIPQSLRDALAHVARNDQSEELARKVVEILDTWLHLGKPK